MDRERVEELRGRVEGATKPDREIDRTLAKLAGWHRVEPRFARNKRGAWIAPEDFMGVQGDGRPRLDSLHGTTMWPDVPAYTASLDAALALVERCLPGWTVASISQQDDKSWFCELREGYLTSYNRVAITPRRCRPKTPALALLAALLRALSAEQDGTAGRSVLAREDHVNLPQPPTEQDGEP